MCLTSLLEKQVDGREDSKQPEMTSAHFSLCVRKILRALTCRLVVALPETRNRKCSPPPCNIFRLTATNTHFPTHFATSFWMLKYITRLFLLFKFLLVYKVLIVIVGVHKNKNKTSSSYVNNIDINATGNCQTGAWIIERIIKQIIISFPLFLVIH